MTHVDLEPLVREYRAFEIPPLFRRDEVVSDLPDPARFNDYHVIVGIRRCGKTFYMFQLMRRLRDANYDQQRILYFNFADDRLKPVELGLGSAVIEEYYRQVPQARDQGCYLFLDEVQELKDWQPFLRCLAEHEKVTMVVTGSSSKLSSEELATESRGRSRQHVLLPLSFGERVRLEGREELASQVSSGAQLPVGDQTRLSGLFDSYLEVGGFPVVQRVTRPERIEILQGYVRDVVVRDVSERFERTEIGLAIQLAIFALRNTGCEFSLNMLSESLTQIGYKAYWAKVNRVSELMQQAYLFRLLHEFSMQLAPNSTEVPKVYAVDAGMAYAVSRANQQDVGKRLETVVYLELVRRLAGRRIESVSSYTAPKAEDGKVDFVVGDALSQIAYEPIQVTANMQSAKTRARELGALEACMRNAHVGHGTVVTLEEQETVQTPAGQIDVVPAWRWLLTPMEL